MPTDVPHPRCRPPRLGLEEWLYAGWAWGLLAALAVPVWAGVVAAPTLNGRWAFARGAARLLFGALGIPIRVKGQAHLPEQGPCVLVANHASWSDALLFAAAWPGRFVFTPSRDFERAWGVRLFMARLGCRFVGGSGKHGDTAALTRLVREGHSVLVFPEGNVWPEAGLHRFHGGAFVAAAETGAPVLPVVITGSRMLFQHGCFVPRWSPVELEALAPLGPSRDFEWLRARARQAIAEAGEEPDLEAAESGLTVTAGSSAP